MEGINQTDILVIGSGAAGMMAALAAASEGRKCILLERGSHIAVSNGARACGPALANTKLQREEHAVVTEEKLFSHMYGFSRGVVNAALLRRAISSSKYVDEIFEKCGVKMELLPDTYGVGFRARQAFKTVGKKRWQPLADVFTAFGGEVHFSRQGTNILLEGNGDIKIRAVDPANPKNEYWYQGKAVIIATGGFLGSEKMIREHFGDIHVLPLGSRMCDGSGIEMALKAGGVKDRNWGICANEFGGANYKFSKGAAQFSAETRYASCGGLLVNRQGGRFMNEQYLSDFPLSMGGEAVLREGVFYAVLDSEMYDGLGEKSIFEYYGCPKEWRAGSMNKDPLRERKEGGLEKAIRNGWAFTGTLKEVAKAAGLPELIHTVEEYNKSCEKKEDTLFGKKEFLLKPLKKEPYYLFEYEPSAWCTLGGIKTDEFCRIMDIKQNVVRGVYVAGVDNGSCYCAPYYDNEGAAFGIALMTGIVAGQHASQYVNLIMKE